MSLYAHRLARVIERCSREAAGELVPLRGRTYAEHEAATGEDAQLVEWDDERARQHGPHARHVTGLHCPTLPE